MTLGVKTVLVPGVPVLVNGAPEEVKVTLEAPAADIVNVPVPAVELAVVPPTKLSTGEVTVLPQVALTLPLAVAVLPMTLTWLVEAKPV